METESQFADDIFNLIFLDQNDCISIQNAVQIPPHDPF